MDVIKALILLLTSVFSISLHAQKLESRINFHCDDISLNEALELLEKQEAIIFSYSPNTLDIAKRVSITASSEPLKAVLIQLVGSDYQFKSSKNYIIISKDKKAEKMLAVKGYIKDEQGNSLKDVTVYDRQSRYSTNTDKNGYYELYIKREIKLESISVSKAAYADTSLLPLTSSASYQSVILNAPRDTSGYIDLSVVRRSWDNLAQEIAVFWIKNRPEATNVSDTIFRKFQTSFVPFIGTNRKLSANCSNGFSFNILGGYAFSSRSFELGGLFNMNRENAIGFQLAGLYNLNGGSQEGAQISGLFGYNHLHSKGFQLGGLFNINPNGFDGAAIAGLCHVTSGESRGFQLSGLGNVNLGRFDGTQIGGLFNYSRETQVQLGPFNIAKKASSQLGFINIADTLTGIPIGFLNFIKTGYHKLELSYDSDEYLNVGLRTGVTKLYTILFSAIQPQARDTTEWSFGYGIGTAPRISNKIRLNIDLTSQQMMEGVDFDYLNINNKLQLGLEWQVSKRFGLFAAGSINYSIADKAVDYHPYFDHRTLLYSEEYTSTRAELWIGWKAGIRFF